MKSLNPLNKSQLKNTVSALVIALTLSAAPFAINDNGLVFNSAQAQIVLGSGSSIAIGTFDGSAGSEVNYTDASSVNPTLVITGSGTGTLTSSGGSGISIHGSEGGSASTNAQTFTITLGNNTGAQNITVNGSIVADGSDSNGGANDDLINITYDGNHGHTLNLGDGSGTDVFDLGINAGGTRGTITLSNADDNLNIVGSNGVTTSFTGNIATDAASQGDVSFAGAGSAIFSVLGNIGTSSNTFANLSVGESDTLRVGGSLASNLTVGATTITLNSGSTLQFNPNAANSVTVTGNVVTASGAATRGAIIVDATTTFSGLLGSATSGQEVGNITIAGSEVLNVDGGMNVVGNVTLSAEDAELEIGSTSGANTITGNILATVDNHGVLDIDDDLTLIGNIGANAGNSLESVDIAASQTLTLGQSGTTITYVNTDSGVTVNGTLSLTNGISLANGAGTEITFNASSGLTIGSITPGVSGGYWIAGAGTVNFAGATTVTLPSTFSSGTLNLIDTSTVTASNTNNITFTGNSLSTYTISSGVVTATVKSGSEISQSLGITEQEASSVSAVLGAISGSSSSEATSFVNAVTAGGESSRQALQQVTPDVTSLTGGGGGAGTSAAISNFGNVSTRLAEVRTGNKYASSQAGLAAGNTVSGNNLWLRGFGSFGEQDQREQDPGYESDVYGATAGIDIPTDDQTRLGAALGYSVSDISGKGAGNSQTDVDSYQITFYGEHNIDESQYVTGMLSYAYNDSKVDQTAFDVVYSGDYSSSQYGASAEYGYAVPLGGNVYFTPKVGSQYFFVSSESFDLTSSTGVFNRTVDLESTNVLLGYVGGQLDNRYRQGNSTIIPALHAKVLYDFIGDEGEATTQYTAGGGSLVQSETPDVEELSFNSGLSLVVEGDYVSVSAGYDYTFKEDYDNHTGQAKVSLKF